MNVAGGEQKAAAKNKPINIVAWLIGAAVGTYSGANLLFPLFFTGISGWFAKKFLPQEKMLVLPVFAIQCGHAMWMALGILWTGKFGSAGLDVVLFGAGLSWLVVRPGRGALYLLGGYQLFALLYNSHVFYGTHFGTANNKALLIHLIWRSLALWQMVLLYRKLKTGGVTAPLVAEGRVRGEG